MQKFLTNKSKSPAAAMTIVAEAGAQPAQHLANKAPVLRIINREAIVKPLQEVKAVPEESESKNSSSSSSSDE